jgi:hypothetical protein
MHYAKGKTINIAFEKNVPQIFLKLFKLKNVHLKSKNTVTCIGTDILFSSRKILESSEKSWQVMDVRSRQPRNVYFNAYAKNASQTMCF